MKTCQYLSTTLVAALLFLLGTDHVLAQLTRTDSQIAYYQQLIKRNPRNGKAFYGLGDALIRKARETGDPSYFNRAEEALKKSLEITPKNAGAMRHLAYVFYSRHEFEPAAVLCAQSNRNGIRQTEIPTVFWVTRCLKSANMMKLEDAYQKMMQLEE